MSGILNMEEKLKNKYNLEEEVKEEEVKLEIEEDEDELEITKPEIEEERSEIKRTRSEEEQPLSNTEEEEVLKLEDLEKARETYEKKKVHITQRFTLKKKIEDLSDLATIAEQLIEPIINQPTTYSNETSIEKIEDYEVEILKCLLEEAGWLVRLEDTKIIVSI